MDKDINNGWLKKRVLDNKIQHSKLRPLFKTFKNEQRSRIREQK